MTGQSLDRRIARNVRVTADGCWLWTGYCNQGGYGRIKWHGRLAMVHRVVLHLERGLPVWPGLGNDEQVDHLCRNRACCNPAHLEVVDRRTNASRGANGKNLTIGRLGVQKSGRRWAAGFALHGRRFHVGTFDTAEQAALARDDVLDRLNLGGVRNRDIDPSLGGGRAVA